jgi:hypothetical protein
MSMRGSITGDLANVNDLKPKLLETRVAENE